ncbi:hypothetical protein [Thioalkalivibrio thiocyanodenitrificans]|uniref:hypothetical protein n=1 Tax=Thioalkalivibrio thiocyanodenitrificans TaxID=243063 RepID=UPI0038CDC042
MPGPVPGRASVRVRERGPLSVVSGQWSVVSGQWSVVSGQWSVVSGQWSVVSGQWSVVSGQKRDPAPGGVKGFSTTDNGPLTTDN